LVQAVAVEVNATPGQVALAWVLPRAIAPPAGDRYADMTPIGR
jgi:hypothetical protein